MSEIPEHTLSYQIYLNKQFPAVASPAVAAPVAVVLAFQNTSYNNSDSHSDGGRRQQGRVTAMFGQAKMYLNDSDRFEVDKYMV